MDKFIQTTKVVNVGKGTSLKITTDNYKGMELDSSIEVSSGTLCIVTRDKLDSFVSDFKQLIEKYQKDENKDSFVTLVDTLA